MTCIELVLPKTVTGRNASADRVLELYDGVIAEDG
jgi:hypothetical protein